MSTIRIVVADQAQAIFYDALSLEARPAEVGRISDPIAHQHDVSSPATGRPQSAAPATRSSARTTRAGRQRYASHAASRG